MTVKFFVPLNATNVKTGTLDVSTKGILAAIDVSGKGSLAEIDVSGIALFKSVTNFDVIPTAPTAPDNDSSTKLATTAYTQAALTALETKVFGGISPETLDTIKEISDFLKLDADPGSALVTSLALKADKTDVTNSLALKVDIASPTFTGTLTASTTNINGNLTATDAKINGTLTINGLDSYGDYTFKSVLNGPGNLTDKLVLSKTKNGVDQVIMEMSQDEASTINQVEIITFSAPVVMNNKLKLSGLQTTVLGLSAGDIYVENGFLKIF